MTTTQPDERNWSRRVYDEILVRLRHGQVGAGDRLVDTALARELGVSRMPVRQALLSLAHEGYLVGTSRGFVLPSVSAADAAELFEIRGMIEPGAAAAATGRLKAVAIDTLDALHRDAIAMSARGDVAGFSEANRHFREIWLDHVPNRRLAEVIHRFAAQTDAVRRRTFEDSQARDVALAILADVAGAFRARDAGRVRAGIALMIERGGEQFDAMLEREAAATGGAVLCA